MSTTVSAPDSADGIGQVVTFPSLPPALLRRRLRAVRGSHSRAVRMLRFALPGMAALMLAALVLLPQGGGAATQAGLRLLQSPLPADVDGAGPHMLNPRLVSVGADEKPLYIRAASAVQPEGPRGPIILQKPEADLVLENGDKATVAAGSAVFRPDQPQDIQLQGGVRFADASGNSLSSRTLTVDTTKQTAFSNEPVQATFPSGSVAADGITISDGGLSIQFRGRTTSKVTVDAAPPAAAK